MTRINRVLCQAYIAYVRSKSGATAIEYGLLAAGISVVIIATVFLLGTELDVAFNKVLDEIKGAGGE